jgi:hypothetical protein
MGGGDARKRLKEINAEDQSSAHEQVARPGPQLPKQAVPAPEVGNRGCGLPKLRLRLAKRSCGHFGVWFTSGQRVLGRVFNHLQVSMDAASPHHQIRPTNPAKAALRPAKGTLRAAP